MIDNFFMHMQNNFNSSGPWRHLPWEAYRNEEDEEAQVRNFGSKQFTPTQSIHSEDGWLKVNSIINAGEVMKITKWENLWAVLELCTSAFTILKLCDADTISALTTCYKHMHMASVPDAFRGHFLNVIRLTHR